MISDVDCGWNVMAHVQKPHFVFRRNEGIHLNRPGGRQFSRLLSAEVCASAVVMLDTPCSEVVWRVLTTHSIRQFPLHFPSCVAPCAITFQLDSTTMLGKAALLQHRSYFWYSFSWTDFKWTRQRFDWTAFTVARKGNRNLQINGEKAKQFGNKLNVLIKAEEVQRHKSGRQILLSLANTSAKRRRLSRTPEWQHKANHSRQRVIIKVV